MSQDILLISDVMLKERTAVHGNIDPKLIYPEIKVAQDMFIEKLLGTSLYNKLLDLIDSGTLSDPSNTDYKTLLDRYIVDALLYYTMMTLVTTTSFQIWNKGVVRKQGVDTELPSMSEIVDLSNLYRNRAELYAERLRKYLRQNASTKFPEYLNPGNGIDDTHPSGHAYTTSIYLGIDDECPKTLEERYQGNNPNCCD